MIPEQHKQNIIADGLRFMRSVTEAYGSDKGMQMWETIADAIDPDLKGELFFAMITGEYNTTIRINGVRSSANKVSLIKALRCTDKRQPGLKEAKDLVDALQDIGKKFVVEVAPEKYNTATRELSDAGFIF